MLNQNRIRMVPRMVPACFLAAALLSPAGAALAQRENKTNLTTSPANKNTPAGTAPVGESAPPGEVSSGQRVTGFTRTHKDKYSKASPEQPAPATPQAMPRPQLLEDDHLRKAEQVAPTPDKPVKPGTRPGPNQDVPRGQ
jgi:hypothetical protein